MPRRPLLLAALCLLALTGCKFGSSSSSGSGNHESPQLPPNILFIVIDDVGVDQFASFGYGGAQPAQTTSIDAIAQAGVRFRNTRSMPTCSPTRSTFFEGRYPFRSGGRNAIASNDLANSQVSPYDLTPPRTLRDQARHRGAPPAQTTSIDAIAQAGVRFRNTWSMPTCSPTRSTFFEGRYPFRSGVRNAIVSNDLANSQVSPYSLTTPRLLREQAGYVSALIGKMHLTGSDINPANHPLGDDAMRELGWDYFAGYLDGAPYPIDTTAGG